MLQMISFQNQSHLSRATSLSSLTGKNYFIVRVGPEKVPRRSSLSSQMGRNTKTPWNTVMSSPRQRAPVSSAMPLGCVLFFMVPSDSLAPHPGKKAGRLFSSAASLLQVGAAFQELTARQELSTIGSTPSKEHVFKVDNFAALSSIQKLLQEKIFAVEGKGE